MKSLDIVIRFNGTLCWALISDPLINSYILLPDVCILYLAS